MSVVETETTSEMRVRLYVRADDSKWKESGTGQLRVARSISTEGSCCTLTAESEVDGNVFLDSPILADTAYQKQQDTLIVWSDNDIVDLAISFQDKCDCDLIWALISEIQGQDSLIPSDLLPSELSEDDDEDTLPVLVNLSLVELPSCQLDNLEEILQCIQMNPIDSFTEELSPSYLTCLLCQVFPEAEEKQDRVGLDLLYKLALALIDMNVESITDSLTSADCIVHLLGVLEYSSCIQRDRTAHRQQFQEQWLQHRKQLHISMSAELDAAVLNLARTQYLLDYALPVDSLLSVQCVKDVLLRRQSDVLEVTLSDSRFLSTVCQQLGSLPVQDVSRRVDLCAFIKELLVLERAGEDRCLRSLLDHNLAAALAAAVRASTKLHCLNLLSVCVELNPARMQEELVLPRGSILLTAFLSQCNKLDSEDVEVSYPMQFYGLLAGLLSPPPQPLPQLPLVNISQITNSKFSSHFYQNHLLLLCQPLQAPNKYLQSYSGSVQLSHLLDLLSSCLVWHTDSLKGYVIQQNWLSQLISFFVCPHRVLVLSALRFLRCIICMGDQVLFQMLIKGQVIGSLLKLVSAASGMVLSALLDTFRYLITHQVKVLLHELLKLDFSSLLATPLADTLLDAVVKESSSDDQLSDRSKQLPRLCRVRRKRCASQDNASNCDTPPPVMKRVCSDSCFSIGSMPLLV